MKLHFVSLGCPKNSVDLETILGGLTGGIELVDDPEAADVALVNTCAFITSAKQEAVETILQLAALKEERPGLVLLVSGCLPQRYRSELEELLPEVDHFFFDLDAGVTAAGIADFLGLPAHPCVQRYRLTPRHYAYLRIAEGCDNRCTYCAIPLIRGKFRSVPMEDVLKEARFLAENGVTELVVIAQDTALYGKDLYGEPKLAELLTELCRIDGLKWIRTLYCYPERITDELLDVIAREDKIVKYMEIPIQHCNGDILSRMNRWGDTEKLEALFRHIREKVPGVILRTTLITGFPGETEEQFNELAEFVKRVRFDRLGCFPYSREEGTKAADFPDQIDEETAAHRADIIMEQQMLISCENNEKLMGCELEAVVEGFDKFGECYFGRTPLDAPDIDGKVFFTSDDPLEIGQYVTIRITDTLDYDLIGEVISK